MKWRWFFGYVQCIDKSTLLCKVRVGCPSIFMVRQRGYTLGMDIMLDTGVQQGDSKGTLLFALVLHLLIN